MEILCRSYVVVHVKSSRLYIYLGETIKMSDITAQPKLYKAQMMHFLNKSISKTEIYTNCV